MFNSHLCLVVIRLSQTFPYHWNFYWLAVKHYACWDSSKSLHLHNITQLFLHVLRGVPHIIVYPLGRPSLCFLSYSDSPQLMSSYLRAFSKGFSIATTVSMSGFCPPVLSKHHSLHKYKLSKHFAICVHPGNYFPHFYHSFKKQTKSYIIWGIHSNLHDQTELFNITFRLPKLYSLSKSTWKYTYFIFDN